MQILITADAFEKRILIIWEAHQVWMLINYLFSNAHWDLFEIFSQNSPKILLAKD